MLRHWFYNDLRSRWNCFRVACRRQAIPNDPKKKKYKNKNKNTENKKMFHCEVMSDSEKPLSRRATWLTMAARGNRGGHEKNVDEDLHCT